MTALARTTCILGVLAAVVAAGAGPATRMVSVERQLRLKRNLLMGEESLVATLQANRQRWEQLDPTRQDELRRQAYAFRGADEQQQRKIMEAWERFWRLNEDQQDLYRRRAAWCKAVIDTLSDEQKQQLAEMSPTDRARELLRLGEAMTQAQAAPPAEM